MLASYADVQEELRRQMVGRKMGCHVGHTLPRRHADDDGQPSRAAHALRHEQLAKRFADIRRARRANLELLGDDLKFVRLAGAGDVSVDALRHEQLAKRFADIRRARLANNAELERILTECERQEAIAAQRRGGLDDAVTDAEWAAANARGEIAPPEFMRRVEDWRLAMTRMYSSTELTAPWLAGAAGLEPAANGLENRCSIQLSYAPAPVDDSKTPGAIACRVGWRMAMGLLVLDVALLLRMVWAIAGGAIAGVVGAGCGLLLLLVGYWLQ